MSYHVKHSTHPRSPSQHQKFPDPGALLEKLPEPSSNPTCVFRSLEGDGATNPRLLIDLK